MAQTQSFGELLRERRTAKAESDPAFSLRQLADRVGIEPSYLSKIERGEQPPPGEQNIRRLAGELGEDPDALLALAGKVSSDLLEIIRERPKVVAELLRAMRGLSARRVSAISRQIRDGYAAFSQLAMLIGTPEEVLPDGCWRKYYRSGERHLPKIGDESPADGEGIVILSGETGSTETLLMSLYAARQHWSGPIELWHQGGEDGSLQIVCARLRIVWVPIFDWPGSAAAFINNACLQAPFDRTLILSARRFLIGKPLFAGGPNSQAKGERDPLLVTRTGDFLINPAIRQSLHVA